MGEKRFSNTLLFTSMTVRRFILVYISDYPRILNEEDMKPSYCNWILDSTEECVLEFNCNPVVDTFVIMKGKNL